MLNLTAGNPTTQGIRFPLDVLDATWKLFTEKSFYQPFSRGNPVGCAAIKGYYAEQNFEVNDQHILITAGTSESYRHIFSFLTSPGDSILVPEPSYPLLDYVAGHVNVATLSYRLIEARDWQIDFEQLESLITIRTKAIVTISPHNPTGHVLSEGEWEKLDELAAKYDLAIVCDEVFCEFLWDQDGNAQHRPMTRITKQIKAPLIFILNGLSKMVALPWVKCGWIVIKGKNHLVDHAVWHLEIINDTYLSCNSWVQQALPQILASRDEFVRVYRAQLQDRLTGVLEMVSHSPGIQFQIPEGGYYMIMKIQQSRYDEEGLVLALLERESLYLFPGYFFGMNLNETTVVLSFLTNKPDLLNGTAKLIKFVDAI